MQDLIRVPVWEIGPRSFKIEKEPPMISSTCVVFAKSEVVGLLESGMPENDIMAAYCSAMAHRIMELLHRLGVKEKFVITGGIAKNEGVVKRLEGSWESRRRRGFGISPSTASRTFPSILRSPGAWGLPSLRMRFSRWEKPRKREKGLIRYLRSYP